MAVKMHVTLFFIQLSHSNTVVTFEPFL